MHNRFNYEHLLYLLALALALGLRLILLGSTPLSDFEAGWALQALHLTQGNPDLAIQIGPQPAYIILSSALFGLFGSSNFLARFFPAIFGGLIVFVPYCLSRQNRPHVFRPTTALILAFGLALSPGLVVASRLAGGPMMAISCLLLAIGFLYIRQPALAGIMASLSLLSGSAAVFGILGLAIAVFIAWLLNRQDDSFLPYPIRWKPLLLSAAITILMVATFLFRFPQGLAGWYETIPSFLMSWVTISGVPASRILAALVFYAPIAVIFGVLGIVRFAIRKSDSAQKYIVLLSIIWTAIVLVLLLVNPGRQVSDLVWGIVPLLILAASEVSLYLPTRPISAIAVGQAIVIGILLGYLWLISASLTRIPPQTIESTTRYLIIGLIFVMVGLITALVSIGWSWKVARLGLVWGILAALGLYTFSNISGASYLRSNQPQELWGTGPAIGNANLLTETIAQLSAWHTGRADSIDVVSEVDTPSLRWLLRDYPNAQFVNVADRQSHPSILITSQSTQAPELAALYRGEDFTWRIYPGWQGAIPDNFMSWFTFRDAPLGLEKIILWARTDIFPGGLTQ